MYVWARVFLNTKHLKLFILYTKYDNNHSIIHQKLLFVSVPRDTQQTYELHMVVLNITPLHLTNPKAVHC